VTATTAPRILTEEEKSRTVTKSNMDVSHVNKTEDKTLLVKELREDSEAQEGDPVNVGGQIMKVLHLVFSKRLIFFLPQQIFTGISIAYYSGMLVPILTASIDSEDQQLQFQKSLLAMVALGAGEMIGSLIQGQVVDKVGNRTPVIIIVVSLMVTIAVTLFYIKKMEFGWLAYVMTGLWGFQDGALNTHTYQMLGFEFEDSATAFAMFNLIQAVGCVTFQLLESIIEERSYLVYTCVIGIIGVLFSGLTYFFDFRKPYVERVLEQQGQEDSEEFGLEDITKDTKYQH